MSTAVRHLSVDEVVAIDERLAERFGGQAGVPDRGLLEAALFRPRTGYYDDVVTMAAALLESLLMARPFAGPPLRGAFFVTEVFLRLNGWQVRSDAREAAATLGDLAARGEADLRRLEAWLRTATVRLAR